VKKDTGKEAGSISSQKKKKGFISPWGKGRVVGDVERGGRVENEGRTRPGEKAEKNAYVRRVPGGEGKKSGEGGLCIRRKIRRPFRGKRPWPLEKKGKYGWGERGNLALELGGRYRSFSLPFRGKTR